MRFGDAEHHRIVAAHWNAPRLASRPGLKAVELFEAVRQGRIKALWIMATNPAVSMPDSSAIAEALRTCPFVAVSDITAATDTARHAHVLFPATGWGEKDGTVTNSERRISRQRAFLPPPGAARPDWRIICDVAKAMGFAGFDFQSPAAIFREHAALTASGNGGRRLLDLSALIDADYDQMQPFQWGPPQAFADGAFETPDGRARFIATPFAGKPPAAGSMTLNSGRIRDQWHTMTRTGLAPRLFARTAEPFLEISPADAEALGLIPAGLAAVESRGRAALARVMVTSRIRPGSVFMPMQWNAAFSAAALANLATDGGRDPVSGQPDLKAAAVAVKPWPARWYGFGVSRQRPGTSAEYWSTWPVAHGFAIECAGRDTTRWSEAAFRAMMGLTAAAPDFAAACDASRGHHRFAAFSGGRLAAALFVGPQPVDLPRSWAAALLAQGDLMPVEVLAGLPRHPGADQGAMICICNGVGRNTIARCVLAVADLEAVCQATGAGTACGSCRPQVARIISEQQATLRERGRLAHRR